MGSIRFDKVDKVFGPRGSGVKALDDINLEIGEKEFVAIVGPSGCGKTTCMRMAAGFEFPSSGSVTVGGKPGMGPGSDCSVVLQHFSLFQEKTATENIDFGLRAAGVPAAERRARIERYIAL